MSDRPTWDATVSSFSVLEMIDEHSEVGRVTIDAGAAYEKRSLIIARHKRMTSDGRFVMLEYSLPYEHAHHLYADDSKNDDNEIVDAEEVQAPSSEADAGSFFGSLFRADDERDEPSTVEKSDPVKDAGKTPAQPQMYLWAEIVSSVENDFRSAVNVIRSSDLVIGGGGLLGSVLSAMKSLVSANPSHSVARGIALKYAKNALMGLLRDADTLLSMGAFDEALEKFALLRSLKFCLWLLPDHIQVHFSRSAGQGS
jgi:hypothetical protein